MHLELFVRNQFTDPSRHFQMEFYVNVFHELIDFHENNFVCDRQKSIDTESAICVLWGMQLSNYASIKTCILNCTNTFSVFGTLLWVVL